MREAPASPYLWRLTSIQKIRLWGHGEISHAFGHGNQMAYQKSHFPYGRINLFKKSNNKFFNYHVIDLAIL